MEIQLKNTKKHQQMIREIHADQKQNKTKQNKNQKQNTHTHPHPQKQYLHARIGQKYVIQGNKLSQKADL